MTHQCQLTVMTALRDYKRENLRLAKEAGQKGQQHLFQHYMEIDEAVEIAMQEIAVAQ